MVTLAIRFLKRLAVLVPGLAVAYVSIFNIFPLLNDHLPAVVAVVVTYWLGAYILIPGSIRLIRIFIRPQQLPRYCLTPDGFASDPLNIAIIGTRQEVTTAMAAAGWYDADRLTPRTILRTIFSTIYGWHYPTAPMSNLYLFGRRQDLAFQIPITDTGSRHHVRFWAATYHESSRFSVRSIDWQNRQAHVRDDRLIWIGAASRDIGITLIRHNAQLTHLVDPDTDAERELVVDQLAQQTGISLYRNIKLDDPYKLANLRGWYRHLKADGRMKILLIGAESN